MGRFAAWARTAAPAVVVLQLTACGGDGGAEPAPVKPASPEAVGPLSRIDAEACLADAGLELATGETPLISGAEGIGINPGEGPLQPGNITAGVFVYASAEEAASASASVEGAAFAEVVQEENVMVVYAEPPTADVRSAIEACTSGG
jgi:hypothetical protein